MLASTSNAMAVLRTVANLNFTAAEVTTDIVVAALVKMPETEVRQSIKTLSQSGHLYVYGETITLMTPGVKVLNDAENQKTGSKK